MHNKLKTISDYLLNLVSLNISLLRINEIDHASVKPVVAPNLANQV